MSLLSQVRAGGRTANAKTYGQPSLFGAIHPIYIGSLPNFNSPGASAGNLRRWILKD